MKVKKAPSVPADSRNLARFHFALRQLQNVTDEAAKDIGLTPRQHQLLLGVEGYTGRGWATVGELAEYLHLRHHSVVGLIDRCQEAGLVRRRINVANRREVHISLTAEGRRKLRSLDKAHRRQLRAMRRSLDLGVD